MMHKTYLSRAMTRAMAADHPIGDPFGGPAYGERRDPISAIVAVGTMAGTYAAAGTFAAMTLMQGLTFAGAALSLVGNITGNRTVSRIGMIAGLAGGVGMLAETVTGSTIGGTLGETFGASAQTGSAAAPLAQTPTATAPPAAPVGELAAPAAMPAASASPGAPMTDAARAQMVRAANATTDPMGSLLQGLGENVAPEVASGIRPLTMGEQAWQGVKDVGSGVMQMSKNNPAAALMLGNAVGSVSDWLSGKTDAEIDALRAQVGFGNARAQQIQEEIERERRRRANLNAGYSQVDASIRVDPNRGVAGPGVQVAPVVAPQVIPSQLAAQPQAAMAMQQMAQQQQQMMRQPGLIAGARN